jgi:fucose permease
MSMQSQKIVNFGSLRKFRGEFWFILVITFLDKLTIQPLLQNSAILMSTKYNISMDNTGSIIALPYLVFVVVSIPLGLFFDRYGLRLSIMMLGFIILMISQSIFLSQDICPEE